MSDETCNCPCCLQGVEAPHEYHLEQRQMPNRDQRVERLIAACEGELDGLAVQPDTAARILAHIDGVALPVKPGHDFTDGWQFFVCYLIDKCEGETVSEEMLQRTAADFLRDPKYGARGVSLVDDQSKPLSDTDEKEPK